MLTHICGFSRLTLVGGKCSCQTSLDFYIYSSLARHGHRFEDSLVSQIKVARETFERRGLPDHISH